jgi:hypothetical protein
MRDEEPGTRFGLPLSDSDFDDRHHRLASIEDAERAAWKDAHTPRFF